MVPQGQMGPSSLRKCGCLKNFGSKHGSLEQMSVCSLGKDGSQMNLACFPKETKETCFQRELKPACFKQPHIIHKELGPFAMETMFPWGTWAYLPYESCKCPSLKGSWGNLVKFSSP
jgi:hypothetical protein